MIDIKADPKRPRGGFAEITVDDAPAFEGTATLSVYNSYQQKWLGPDGWQPNQAEIPARMSQIDGSQLRLIVGPDVVNLIEEDTPIRIEIAGKSWNTYWPDDINHGPDEALIGDLGEAGSATVAKGPTTMTAKPETEDDPDVLSATEAEPDDTVVTPIPHATEDEPKPKLPLILGAVALLAIAIGVGWFVLNQDQTKPVVEVPPTPESAPVADANPCSIDTLNAAKANGFAALADDIRACGSAVSADDVLGFVEQAAAENDPTALALFGAIYDETVTDETLENEIGLTFSDQPDRAAEYYHRAIAAGSEEAVNHLGAVCERLLLRSDTLSQSALEDYCQ